MRCIYLSCMAVLAVPFVAVADTHTIVVAADSITPATLEVAPGDTIFFDSICATTVSTGQSCQADGILSGTSYPPFCPDFEWTIPQLASVDLPIYAMGFDGVCNDNRTAVITIVTGATLSVPGDYATIGDAIAAAQSGDRIDIAAGTYFEHDLSIDKTINLAGETNPDGSPAVKIDAQQQGRVFELIGGGPSPGEPGLIIMDNLIITGGAIDGDGGGVSILNCSPILRNCRIVENSCTGNGGGAHVRRAAQSSPWVNAQPTFASCMIMDNDALDGGGVHCVGDEFGSGCQPTFKGCLVIDNMASDGYGGLRHVGIGQATVEESIICGNYPGQYAGNVDLDNSCTFTQCLDSDGDGTVDDCEAGDEDGILNVPSEYETFPVAWEEVTDGDTISIAAGTYVITEVDELRMEDTSVSIIGETNPDGTPAVILDALNHDNFFYMALLGEGSGQSSIENIHFRQFGSGIGLGPDVTTIRNCIIEQGYSQAAGLLLYNYQGTVENCWIHNNQGYALLGGVGLFDEPDFPASNATLVDCLIEGNAGSGPFGSGGYGGVYCSSGTSPEATVNLIGCTIRNNNGGIGGIGVLLDWNVTLTDTVVCQNSTPEQIYGPWEDLGGNTLAEICPADCPADLDGNGEVGVDDLLFLISEWDGPNGDCNGDGTTDVNDLLYLIGVWGTCD